MSLQWVGPAISVLVMLGGTAVNLFIIGRFIGQLSETVRNVTATVSKVEARLEEIGQETDKIPLIDQRLSVVEIATSKFWEMRDEFTAMRVTVEQEGRHSREKLDSLARGQSVIERQLANLVTSKAGFTVIQNEEGRQ